MKKCKMCNSSIPDKRVYCSNKCKFSDKDYNKSRVSGVKNVGNKLLKCKLCDYTSTDENNKSGCLTRHIRTHTHSYDNLFDYFDVVDYVDNTDKWKCPLCDWSTPDTQNKSGCITNHIKTKHNLTVTEFSNIYPNNNFNSKQHRLKNRFLDKDDYVECKICNEKLAIISNTHCMNIHGITQNEYKSIYGDDIISKNLSKVLQKCGGSKSFVSKGEIEIIEFLNELGITNIQQSKLMGGYEIDIFLTDYDVGIEFNGLYWHSELRGRGSKYHLDKTKYFSSKGIRIIHIFDDEWNVKKDIVKSKLSHILHKSDKTVIYARKCVIKLISSKTASQFLSTNHIQSNDKSNIKLGLYFDNRLVSVATFSNKRIALGHKNSKNTEYELSRYATDIECRVVGGISKLLKYFINNYNPTSITTYADYRYSVEDNMYSNIGFNMVGYTKPNYFYTKDHSKRLHRFNFTKHRIVAKFGGNPQLTEWENMINLGYDRVWDCGSIKYEMKC
jgi:hypothetical protein